MCEVVRNELGVPENCILNGNGNNKTPPGIVKKEPGRRTRYRLRKHKIRKTRPLT